MVEELVVHGVGGIKDASMTFSGDFIVITGESGSGKSSLVRALEFISGKRAQTNLIHSNEDSCDVQLLITTDRLIGLDDEYQPQDGTVLVRRFFNRSGRGKLTIQNVMLPLNALSSAMESEIVIQSQFAQLGLLDPNLQLELVDSCGGEHLAHVKAQLNETFKETLLIEKEILAVKKKRTEMEEKYQDAEGIIRQIHSLELAADSEDLWLKELKDLENNVRRYESYKMLSNRFSGASSGEGLIEELENIAKDIYAVIQEPDSSIRADIEKMLYSAQEVSKKLNTISAAENKYENVDEIRDRLEKKLGILRKIKRSLNLKNCRELADYAISASEALLWLKEVHNEIDELEIKAKNLKKKISSLAVEIRNIRKDSARALAQKVNNHLRDLAMEYALFNIEIEELNRVRANGAENASFTLTLPDQHPQPVGKTASGGELSRILIALQLAVGDDKLPGTLIFDEVEAGLGGKTALLAGYKLRELSQRCRTILITHEATIAAMADQHFLVKRTADDTVISEIKGDEREKEIARMLAGDETSNEALKHAKSLLDFKKQK